MNIAFFSECYYPIINGVIISIETYKKELTNLGHNVFIFAPENPGYKEKEENIFRLKSLSYPKKVDYRFPLPLPLEIFRKIKELKINLIHTQTPFFVGALAYYIARRNNLPLIFTFHTKYHEYTHYVPLPQGLLKATSKRWSRIFCNRCSHIIAPSEDIKSMLIEFGVKKPISVIPTGINLDEFKDVEFKDIKERYKIPEDKIILIFAGRLAKEKNVEFLIDAFKLIQGLKSNTHLLMVGGGPEEENLKLKIKSLELENSVTLTGLLPKSEVLPFYNVSDIFIFSSLTETQGLVILEAQASGLPVVAIKATGVDDVINDGLDGYLTKNNILEFIGKILQLIEDKDLREKFGNSAKSNAKKFSSTNQALKLIKIYERYLVER